MVEPLEHAAGGDPPDRLAGGPADKQDRVDAVAHHRAFGVAKRRVVGEGDDPGAHELAYRRVEPAVGDTVSRRVASRRVERVRRHGPTVRAPPRSGHRQGATATLRETTDQPERGGFLRAGGLRRRGSAPRPPWRARSARALPGRCARTARPVASPAPRSARARATPPRARRPAGRGLRRSARAGRRWRPRAPRRRPTTARCRRCSRSSTSWSSSTCRCIGASSCRGSSAWPVAEEASERIAACHSRRRSDIAASSHRAARRTRSRPAPPHGWQRLRSSSGSVSVHRTEARHATEDRHRLRRHTSRRRPRSRPAARRDATADLLVAHRGRRSWWPTAPHPVQPTTTPGGAS